MKNFWQNITNHWNRYTVRRLMNKKYKAWVEVENVGNKEFVYLFVSHNRNSCAGISIKNAKVEIPLIIDALQRYLANVAHLDGKGQCVCPAGVGICGFGDPDTNICNYRSR